MDIFAIARNPEGLTNDEIAVQLEKSLEGRKLENVLIIPPDFTRYHSNAAVCHDHAFAMRWFKQ